MTSIQPGPALPWAASAENATCFHPQHADQGGVELAAVSIEQLGLKIGDRIQVKWLVEPDGGEPFNRWWGASIAHSEELPTTSGANAASATTPATGTAAAGATATGPAAATAPLYHLKYDAYGDDFDEEVAPVSLLSDHQLYDVERQEVMFWRAEGDDGYEPPEAGESDEEDMELGAAEGEEGGGVVSVQQLASSISEADVAAGEADMLSSLAGFGAAEQLQMAAGYRDFMDNFKEFVAAKASAASDGGVLITTADVEDFKALMATRRHQQHRRS